MQVGPPVGVMGLEQDMQDWYGQQPYMLGMGYRLCDKLDPSVQVDSLPCLTRLIHCFVPAGSSRANTLPPQTNCGNEVTADVLNVAGSAELRPW